MLHSCGEHCISKFPFRHISTKFRAGNCMWFIHFKYVVSLVPILVSFMQFMEDFIIVEWGDRWCCEKVWKQETNNLSMRKTSRFLKRKPPTECPVFWTSGCILICCIYFCEARVYESLAAVVEFVLLTSFRFLHWIRNIVRYVVFIYLMFFF